MAKCKTEKYTRVMFRMNGQYSMGDLKAVEGGRIGQREYHYRTDLNLKAGELVIVPMKHGNVDYFSLAVVCSDATDESPGRTMPMKKVIGRAPIKNYLEDLEKEHQRKALKVKMQQRMKAVQELTMVEMLAEKDPELKEMLDEYKAIC